MSVTIYTMYICMDVNYINQTKSSIKHMPNTYEGTAIK